MPKAEADVLSSVDRKLTTMSNLIAYQIVQGMTIAEGAPILKRLGLTATEIAAVFDSTANAISVRLAEAKKKPQRRKPK